MRLFKKKDVSRGYKSETLGSLVIQKIQMPHSLVTTDGSHFEVLTWTMRLRVSDKIILFERDYVEGKREDIDAMKSWLTHHTEVRSGSQVEYLFYQDLYDFWSKK